MILILNIKGGLGNQLFQISAALKYIHQNKIKKLYIFHGNMIFYSTSRVFHLNKILFKLPVYVKVLRTGWIIFLNKYMLYFLSKVHCLIVNEKNFNKKSSYIQIMDGYFQSPDFIELSSLTLIKNALKDDQNALLKKLPKKLLSISLDSNIIGLHLRCGDRMSISLLNNFRNSISKINFNQYSKIIFFSDSNNLEIKSEIQNIVKGEVIFIDEFALSDYEEFLVCTFISDFFVSNSTFSIISRLLSSNNRITYFSQNDFKVYGLDIPNLIRGNINAINLDIQQ